MDKGDNILFSDLFEIRAINEDGANIETKIAGGEGEDVEERSGRDLTDRQVGVWHGNGLMIVSRISARSENYDMDLILDINTDLYPLNAEDKFSLVLASSLNVSGRKREDADGAGKGRDDGKEGGVFGKSDSTWRAVVSGTERSLADDYEYVMYGRVYRYDDSNSTQV
ncbi:DNA-directed RNA polymerases I, II, and III subunit RPABC3 [Spiromyces aspiralis]|uniref:DNA-directed RNA polymerases I, II, and III subunit RPABC3 n=1 Tax=Spiromyces aspiralis TaxID=68401 RepID=A0ACC1HNY5_9FUNG|nr:DNA-directed RNA polymerases I, II, and III subunit RPABC3 [Spiromyces aspiralis]